LATNDVPAVPLPPEGSAVPPVEPAPVAAPVVSTPPAASAAPPATDAARPNPYAAPAAPTYSTAPGAYAPAPAGPPQGLSLASMITGIVGVLLSFFGAGFLVSLAAVITGHMAQRRQPHAKPLWLTGIITGYVGLGINLIWGIFILILLVAGLGSASYFG
jgi:hypothetical protein